jgi:hypothetical protein
LIIAVKSVDQLIIDEGLNIQISSISWFSELENNSGGWTQRQ